MGRRGFFLLTLIWSIPPRKVSIKSKVFTKVQFGKIPLLRAKIDDNCLLGMGLKIP